MKILFSLLILFSFTCANLLVIDDALAASKKKSAKESKIEKASKGKKASLAKLQKNKKSKTKGKLVSKKPSKLHKKKDKKAHKLAKKGKISKREKSRRIAIRPHSPQRVARTPFPRIENEPIEKNPIVEMALRDIPLPKQVNE